MGVIPHAGYPAPAHSRIAPFNATVPGSDQPLRARLPDRQRLTPRPWAHRIAQQPDQGHGTSASRRTVLPAQKTVQLRQYASRSGFPSDFCARFREFRLPSASSLQIQSRYRPTPGIAPDPYTAYRYTLSLQNNGMDKCPKSEGIPAQLTPARRLTLLTSQCNITICVLDRIPAQPLPESHRTAWSARPLHPNSSATRLHSASSGCKIRQDG